MKDYWGVDDKTIVFVADPTFANIINFNVGQGIDLEVPTVRRGGGRREARFAAQRPQGASRLRGRHAMIH